jgi:hypothetical protein
MECNGFGYCLTTGAKVICNYDCQPQECPNFWLCSNQVPEFFLEFNQGVCNECVTHLGKCPENLNPSDPILEKKEEQSDCPVCLQEVSITVKNPRCSHYLCESCFKTIYWLDDIEYIDHTAPLFPYSEQKEEEYYQEPELFIHDQQVIRWKKELGSWNELRIQYILENKKYLKHCPICRK